MFGAPWSTGLCRFQYLIHSSVAVSVPRRLLLPIAPRSSWRAISAIWGIVACTVCWGRSRRTGWCTEMLTVRFLYRVVWTFRTVWFWTELVIYSTVLNETFARTKDGRKCFKKTWLLISQSKVAHWDWGTLFKHSKAQSLQCMRFWNLNNFCQFQFHCSDVYRSLWRPPKSRGFQVCTLIARLYIPYVDEILKPCDYGGCHKRLKTSEAQSLNVWRFET